MSNADQPVHGEARSPLTPQPAHAAVAATILEVLSEVRWKHPRTRVSCVARVGPFWRLLGSSQPLHEATPSSRQIFEGLLAPLLNALDAAPGEFLAADARADPRTRDIPAALFGEARSSFFVRLCDHNEVSGFLRMDANDAAELGSHAREALHAAVPYAEVAVALERERADMAACRLSLEELADAVSELRLRQRHASRELDRAIKSLRDLESRTFAARESPPGFADALRRAEAHVRSGFEAVSRDRLPAVLPRESV